MKILEINSVCGIRSTGRIAVEIAEEYQNKGYETMIAFGRENVPFQYESISRRIGMPVTVKRNALESRFLDNDGFTAKKETREFLTWANDYNPDLLWLHNLHGYYINVEMLFEWIKSRTNMEVKWLLHDCWAFTGHCSYYTYVKCDKWKTHCEKCVQKCEYPKSILLDQSFINFERKKKAFNGVENLTIVTPSEWLANEVRDSFLCSYPIEVRRNRIDSKVFKPTQSDMKIKLGIEGKKVVLGVAAQWQLIKGWYDFIELSKMLTEDYVIVLVGVSKKQKSELPTNIIGVERTSDVYELAKLYTAADVFVNPTYEDNYPTTNLEAQACGTPCITYNTGGSVESVNPENVVECGNIDLLLEKIYEITR